MHLIDLYRFASFIQKYLDIIYARDNWKSLRYLNLYLSQIIANKLLKKIKEYTIKYE